MWIHYLESKDDKILSCAKEFAEQAFILSSKESAPNYFVFLKEVIEKFSFSREEKLVEFSKSADNVTTWKVSLKVNSSDFSISSEGYGYTKKLARNLAAKEILPLLFPYCLRSGVHRRLSKVWIIGESLIIASAKLHFGIGHLSGLSDNLDVLSNPFSYFHYTTFYLWTHLLKPKT